MIQNQLVQYSRTLSEKLSYLEFSFPVYATYNPLEYAQSIHEQYLSQYGGSPKKVLFLGMNPGPWGMAQTGIPFGEIDAVKTWLQLSGNVQKPEREHPKRPIMGLDCPRSEVSGRRLWGLFKDLYGDPEAFFKDHFVLNYCPLVFMGETGKNITPDKLPKHEREPIDEACDVHLREVINYLQPEYLIGVGKYAEGCFRRVAPAGVTVGSMLHPSPASPAANRDFEGTALRQLRELGVLPEGVERT